MSIKKYNKSKRTYSFVRTLQLPVFNDRSELVIKGRGMFRCKQTDQLVELRFAPANCMVLKGRQRIAKINSIV